METQAQFRNGYLQPDINPNKKDKAVIWAFVITTVLCVIYQTCLS